MWEILVEGIQSLLLVGIKGMNVVRDIRGEPSMLGDEVRSPPGQASSGWMPA
jgi:hypothetical protein